MNQLGEALEHTGVDLVSHGDIHTQEEGGARPLHGQRHVLLQVAQEIDQTGGLSQDCFERLCQVEGEASPTELRVMATRVLISAQRHKVEADDPLWGHFQRWDPWDLSALHHWVMRPSTAMAVLRPHLEQGTLPEWVGVLFIQGGLDFRHKRIAHLPESICNLVVSSGDLLLSHNAITRLPEHFHHVSVPKGSVDLSHNKLSELPATFGNARIHKSLMLSHNALGVLPAQFGDLICGGHLDLSHNRLETLPASVGRLRVGGDLRLNRNALQELPPEVKNLRVSGDLRVDRNSLRALPAELFHAHIGGALWIGGNYLEVVPDPESCPHRLILDNGRTNYVLRLLKSFMGDFVLGANPFSVVLFILANCQDVAPPYTGWRLAKMTWDTQSDMSPSWNLPSSFLVDNLSWVGNSMTVSAWLATAWMTQQSTPPSPDAPWILQDASLREGTFHMEAYVIMLVLLLGISNAVGQMWDRLCCTPASDFRRHVWHPLWTAHASMVCDLWFNADFAYVSDWIIYYIMTLVCFAWHSMILMLVYNWTTNTPFHTDCG